MRLSLLPIRLRSTCQKTQAVALARPASPSSSPLRRSAPPSGPTKLSNPSRPPLLGRYQTTPLELFRVNPGKNIFLRDYAAQRTRYGRRSYDLHLGPDGLVHPKAGPNFEGPNGASLRPLAPKLQKILSTYMVTGTTIYRLPEGLELPKELVLLHEYSDHYSIQTTRPVSLNDLNDHITDWVTKHGEAMTKLEWCGRYPGPF